MDTYLTKEYNGTMNYLARNMGKRIDPRLLVAGAQTILCFLAPYGKACNGVAGFACGTDYHSVVKERLFQVMEYLKDQFPAFEGRAFVDSAPVLERYWAAKAGLGFIGENHFLISPQYGLRTIIGTIICNIPSDRFEPHAPLDVTSCGSCGKCLKSCPSEAFINGTDGRTFLDAKRCISYNTIENKNLSLPHPVDYHGWVFGCEECLKVCPWNKEIEPWPEFESNRQYIASLSENEWNSLDESSFKEHFGNSGLARSGLSKIKNNLQSGSVG